MSGGDVSDDGMRELSVYWGESAGLLVGYNELLVGGTSGERLRLAGGPWAPQLQYVCNRLRGWSTRPLRQ